MTGVFPITTLIDEFGPLLSVSIISGILVSFVAYFSAIWRGAQHRMTGRFVYDFFMGAELNPRMFGILDLKMFCEVRLPWFILFFVSCAGAVKQYDTFGYVTPQVAFFVLAHWLYVNACGKGEELIVTTWDMAHEKWGYMLIFWNMAGVPMTYCHGMLYLVRNDPSVYHWSTPTNVAVYAMLIAAYYVFDTCNSQKNRFRQMEKGTMIQRKTFPQLPWQTVENPTFIRCKNGGTLLTSGWCTSFPSPPPILKFHLTNFFTLFLGKCRRTRQKSSLHGRLYTNDDLGPHLRLWLSIALVPALFLHGHDPPPRVEGYLALCEKVWR